MIGTQSSRGRFSLIGAICLSSCTFMQVLDYSIANVSIPHIAGDLAVSVSDGTWVITMFAVGNAIALPLTGWLANRLGSVRTMVMATSFFTLLSLLCALSWNIEVLVAMRFFQGLIAGPLVPLSQSLMLLTFPKEKKNIALALWSMVAVVGPITGPILGGWITERYSWPWIFYINLPIGTICSIVIWQLYKMRETPKKSVGMDWVGLALLVVGVSSLQILLDRGEQLDWWSSHSIRTLAFLSVLAFIALVIWEVTDKNPVIDFRLFRNRDFALSVLITSLSYMFMFGTIVITPLWLQTVMGYDAQLAGLAVSTFGILPFCTVLVVARAMTLLPLRYMVMTAFIVFGSVLLYFSTFNTDVTFHQVALARFFLGLGICMYLTPLTALAFSRFPPHQLPTAQGIFHFFRIFMGGVGTTLFVTMWNRRATYHHSRLVEAIDRLHCVSREFFHRIEAHRITGESARGIVDQIAWTQGYMLSTNDLFRVAGLAFLAFACLTLLFKRRRALAFQCDLPEK